MHIAKLKSDRFDQDPWDYILDMPPTLQSVKRLCLWLKFKFAGSSRFFLDLLMATFVDIPNKFIWDSILWYGFRKLAVRSILEILGKKEIASKIWATAILGYTYKILREFGIRVQNQNQTDYFFLLETVTKDLVSQQCKFLPPWGDLKTRDTKFECTVSSYQNCQDLLLKSRIAI